MAKDALGGSISAILNSMHSTGGVNKGSIGEQAVFKICEEFYKTQGGILIHSYSYKVDKDLAGNIKRQEFNDGFFIENLGGSTEIDILYISKFRIFPIEVKAYKAKEITFTDDKIEGCYKTNKSPVHQNEMHCRHLYSALMRAIPEGGTTQLIQTPFGQCGTKYIVPIVCMVDKADILDGRSEWQRDYIKLTILNNLHQVIAENNTPLDFQIDLSLMDKVLKEGMVDHTTYLPPRK